MEKINNDGFNTMVEREPVVKAYAAGGDMRAMVIQGGVYPPLLGKYQQEMTAYKTLANQSYLEKGGSLPTPMSIMFGDIIRYTSQHGKNVDDVYIVLETDKTSRLDAIEEMAKEKSTVFKGIRHLRYKRISPTRLDINLADIINSSGMQPIGARGGRLINMRRKFPKNYGQWKKQEGMYVTDSPQQFLKEHFLVVKPIPLHESPPVMNFSKQQRSPGMIADMKILQAILQSNYPRGFRTALNDNEEKFLEKVTEEFLRSGVQFKNKTQVERLGEQYNIYNKGEIKELTELAIVTMARFIATMSGTIEKKFNHIVNLYQTQVNLSHRTSTSVLLQQYSTPAPIGFLAGEYCKGKSEISDTALYFEPSAGNGLLTIAVPAPNWVVNEIDETRNLHLQSQGYKAVLRLDASKPFALFRKMFDGVITNPPFGALEGVQYDTINIKALDHLMALYALETMKDNGRAAIIIGGHTEYDSEGRIQAGKNRIFLSYLYKHFVVDDVINIDGALYSRMGTSFNVRLILISDRKEIPAGFPPLKNPALTETDNQSAAVVTSFHQLYERILNLLK